MNGIPALSYPYQIFFPTKEIGLDLEGGIRSPVPHQRRSNLYGDFESALPRSRNFKPSFPGLSGL
ncbi:MAG: hypothetical protein HC796_10935, partial [Synechococcaceae cyanobacterium RL_1_2]|nr:hypothetical protein [Synechococcaceae cyanobacterium RL_1_2]